MQCSAVAKRFKPWIQELYQHSLLAISTGFYLLQSDLDLSSQSHKSLSSHNDGSLSQSDCNVFSKQPQISIACRVSESFSLGDHKSQKGCLTKNNEKVEKNLKSYRMRDFLVPVEGWWIYVNHGQLRLSVVTLVFLWVRWHPTDIHGVKRTLKRWFYGDSNSTCHHYQKEKHWSNINFRLTLVGTFKICVFSVLFENFKDM